MTEPSNLTIGNVAASTVRSDLNKALQALGSNSKYATAPTTSYDGQFWYDSTAGILKINNSGSWLDFATIGSSSITPAPGYASQAEAEAGTNNSKLMTPLRTVQGAFPLYNNAANGYTQLASGLLFQWGSIAKTSIPTTKQISYPRSFNAVYSVHITAYKSGQTVTIDTPYIKSDYATTTSYFTIFWSGEADGVTWFAIGV